MVKELSLRVTPRTAASDLTLLGEVSGHLGIDANRIKHLQIVRRSIDARQRNIFVNLTVRAFIDEDYVAKSREDEKPHFPKLEANSPQVIVVGMGPAGLFAAIELLKHGIRPIILERGKDVDSRRLDLAAISKNGVVNPDSNYCFGEGGAGAFSDGKLFTRSKKRGNVEAVLSLLYAYGANPDILVDAHPHIGTDKLPVIIKNIRTSLEEAGAEINFNTRVSSLNISDGKVTGVTTSDGRTFSGPVILATGHSARDVYKFLSEQKVALEPKGIAVGVRLEHPQDAIDRLRYHTPGGRGKFLPPAEYTFLTRVNDRAVYSFCMCPGGVVVPAASREGEVVVNGMSSSARGSQWANSGMVVELLPEDVPGESPLKMMDFQSLIERNFFQESNSLNAPAQLMTDFVAQKPSKTLPRSSYAPGIHPARVDQLLPMGIASRLREGLEEIGKKNRGFLTSKAVVIGCETRTSAPVRIPRDQETLCHIELPGLYPVGEGAGYAGGIVSAALDGINAASQLAKTLNR